MTYKVPSPLLVCDVVQDPTLKSFGLEVSPNMSSLKARVLPPPKLVYGRSICIDPGNKVRHRGGCSVQPAVSGTAS